LLILLKIQSTIAITTITNIIPTYTPPLNISAINWQLLSKVIRNTTMVAGSTLFLNFIGLDLIFFFYYNLKNKEMFLFKTKSFQKAIKYMIFLNK
jgi:hypothetical protein